MPRLFEVQRERTDRFSTGCLQRKGPAASKIESFGEPQPWFPAWVLTNIRSQQWLACMYGEAGRKRVRTDFKTVDPTGVVCRHPSYMVQLGPSCIGDVKGASGLTTVLLLGSTDQHIKRFRERRTIDSILEGLFLTGQPELRLAQSFLSVFAIRDIRAGADETIRLALAVLHLGSAVKP